MSCLENIISVKDFCNPNAENISLSGYEIFNAPEIDQAAVADMIKSGTQGVRDFVVGIIKDATVDIKNDLVAALASNKYIPDLTEKQYNTSSFKDAIKPKDGLERGITIYKVSPSSNDPLKKTIIKEILLNAVTAVEGPVLIYIYDGNEREKLSVNVDEGVNTYQVNYEVKTRSARIVLEANKVDVRSGELTCFVGCNNSLPNDCAYTKSYNGAEVSGKESWGIDMVFSCTCDYDQLLCNMSKVFVGKLIYLKSRIMLLEARINSSRLNNLIIYGDDEAKELKEDLLKEFNDQWNTMVLSLPNTLKGYCGTCIQCNGTTIKPNL